jgi:hypothetical protein
VESTDTCNELSMTASKVVEEKRSWMITMPIKYQQDGRS